MKKLSWFEIQNWLEERIKEIDIEILKEASKDEIDVNILFKKSSKKEAFEELLWLPAEFASLSEDEEWLPL